MSENIKYAGFWSRVLAALIDSVWLIALIYPILYLLMGSAIFDITTPYTLTRFSLEYLLPIVAILTFWVMKSATPGKMLLGMKIVDAETLGTVPTPRLVVRYLGYFVAMIPLFIGILWVGWDKRKQGWHDKLARTVVIKENG